MNKETLFWYVSGLYVVNIVFLIGIIISFSFGVPDYPYDEETHLSITMGSEPVDCDRINYYAVKLEYPSGEVLQCGYQLPTILVTYILIVLLLVLEIFSWILYMQRDGKITIVAVAVACLVPIGSMISLVLQGKDVNHGLSVCTERTDQIQLAKCHAVGYVLAAAITCIEFVLSILLPVFIIYARFIKHHKNPEHSHSRRIVPEDLESSTEDSYNKKNKNKKSKKQSDYSNYSHQTDIDFSQPQQNQYNQYSYQSSYGYSQQSYSKPKKPAPAAPSYAPQNDEIDFGAYQKNN